MENKQEHNGTMGAPTKDDRFISFNKEFDEKRLNLIYYTQNLIYTLGFEPRPQPVGLSFFSSLAAALMDPLQKIKVTEGPKNEAMYRMLKVTINALNEMNFSPLIQTKKEYNGQYDLVSLENKQIYSVNKDLDPGLHYVYHTVARQPGLLVNTVVQSCERILSDLRRFLRSEQQRIDNTLLKI